MSGCIFCDIGGGIDPQLITYEDERTIAFLDRSPASVGHSLVIPKQHCTTLMDISEEDAAAVMIGATRVVHLLHAALDPNGFTLLQANEIAGWQGVFHVHVHVIPRWDENELQSPWEPQEAELDELRATAESIRSSAMTRTK